MSKPTWPRKRTLKVWVGIYKPDDDPCTWSAARERHYCESYLADVYSDMEIARDIRIVRATLTLSPKTRGRR